MRQRVRTGRPLWARRCGALGAAANWPDAPALGALALGAGRQISMTSVYGHSSLNNADVF